MKFRSLLSLAVAIAATFGVNSMCLASEGGVNPMDFKADLALWTLVVFVITLLVLGKFAWKPIMAGLDKREANIANEIAQAEAQNAQAKKLLDDYKAQLRDAKTEITAMLDNAKKNAEKAKDMILDKAKADAEAESKRAAQEIAAAKKEAMSELANSAANLAVDLASKICQSQLNQDAHKKLIDSAVNNFTKQAL